ncbi:hypothetical protein [uncultured Paraglaciecola sp.]|uniref:hypothetical protein n=1 Tax=uncultured Paraglaciecola sp. TaxID=1765024 RepID=UPI0030DC846B|tara:strand:+ start:1458 stop:1874 length:417 start_codon:yes stop_codon:yes gene_type:complete
MPINSESFLEIYSKALNSFDAKKIASFCLPPTIIMTDNSKKVMVSEEELEVGISRMITKFKLAGIHSFVPKLQQTMRLSDSLFFSKMRWQFYDASQQLCFSCATSYTLQKMPDKHLKIIVAVIDDDENKLAEVLARSE